jgi:glutamate synthase domain-containing protein 2
MTWWQWVLVAIVVLPLLALAGLAMYDLVQSRYAILRNFPIIGHLRYTLEAVGPELRQYIVTSNDAELPFSRDQRRWIYGAASRGNRYFGFGTDNDLERSPNYLIVKHVAFPLPAEGAGHDVPCAKVLGGFRGRARAFRMPSAVNISSMSFGSLSGPAVESFNRGAQIAGCLQGTGEGGITPHHLHGGELVWQIGTGYFGCRDESGAFSLSRFLDVVAATPQIRAVEIKLSQGAKPGIGGRLPAAKVTPEIARLRGVPVGVDCVSPARHSAFADADGLLDFAEQLAEASGLPVGIKSAVGHDGFFDDIARLLARGDRAVDFVTIDGGEGGTGAGPLTFTDHVALPFKVGFARVYRIFAEAGVTDRVVMIGSGKLGIPETALLAFAMGCDAVNVGREAMLSIGCIQAQRCHTDRCPTGVTTHSKWLTHGLDPRLKSVQCANYILALREELLQLARACGKAHPAFVTLEDFDILDDHLHATPAREVFGYDPNWGMPSPRQLDELQRILLAQEPSPGGGS